MNRMNPLHTILIAALLTQACALREPFRPRFDARLIVEQHLQCANVEVAEAPASPYARDPLARRTQRLVAFGCGQRVRLECDVFGVRNGACRDDHSYESPARTEQQAVIKVLTRYATTEGIMQRETFRIAGEGDIVRRREAGGNAFAFPIETGPQRITLASDPVLRRIQHHHWTTTHYETRGNDRYRVTQQHHSTSVHHYTEPGCSRTIALAVEPNAIYRVLFDYTQRGQCTTQCVREIHTESGVALISCPGFNAG